MYSDLNAQLTLLCRVRSVNLHKLYWLTKETLQKKNQSCFIQAVISSIYVEINQQKLLAVPCLEGISNFVKQYHQTGVN